MLIPAEAWDQVDGEQLWVMALGGQKAEHLWN